MFTRLHHLGLVVGDLEAAKSLWLDTYGFSVDEERSPLPDGRNVQLDNVNILDIPVGESELEINMANDPNSGTGKFLERRGRINCSMKDKNGWRWLGTQFTIKLN